MLARRKLAEPFRISTCKTAEECSLPHLISSGNDQDGVLYILFSSTCLVLPTKDDTERLIVLLIAPSTHED